MFIQLLNLLYELTVVGLSSEDDFFEKDFNIVEFLCSYGCVKSFRLIFELDIPPFAFVVRDTFELILLFIFKL